jgi:HEAT repeat protein
LDLIKLQQKGDIKGLEKALKDKDPWVREMAMKSLVVTAGGRGLNQSRTVREQACWAISRAFQESKDARVRVEAAQYLSLLYKSGALPQDLKKAVSKIMPKLEKMLG